ncbi:MAG: 3-oxoacyl-ACP synthase [Pseudomonadota bacterium]
MKTRIHILSWGLYLPRKKVRGRDAARALGVPARVVEKKMAFRAKHEPGNGDGCAAMAEKAAVKALRRGGVKAPDIDLLIYCGSEFKEHIVWSAACHIAGRLGARRALCFEVYALCAGLPIALNVARDMMAADRGIRKALVVTASREGDLIDYGNARTTWMSNFGAGGGAILLGRSGGRGVLAGFSGMCDTRLSMSVVQPAGGSSMPASRRTVERNLHNLDVPDMGSMRAILEDVSLPNYGRTIKEALGRSGCGPDDVTLLCLTLMKRSFHDRLVMQLGLDARRAVYLDGVGHMQSVDQVAALEKASRKGLLNRRGAVVFAAAGTGYTWSAMVIKWKGRKHAGR